LRLRNKTFEVMCENAEEKKKKGLVGSCLFLWDLGEQGL